MSPRRFVDPFRLSAAAAVLAVLCTAAGLASCTARGTPNRGVEGAGSDRPNVLLIIADDLNTRIGAYVTPPHRAHTPNLDRLAAEGITFRRAYAQYPVCGPSRASLLSGLYPETSGAISNDFRTANHKRATPALASHPSLGEFFRSNGYYTARVSKIFHVGVPGGLERGETGSDDADAWDFAVDLMAPETMTPGHLETLSRGTHYGSTFARMVLPDGKEGTQADVLAANQAIAILQARLGVRPENATNRTRLKPDAPFFLAVGFVRPHVPFIAPARHFARHPDGEAIVPLDTVGADVPEAALRFSNDGRWGMDEEQQRKVVAAYHASVSFMDEQVGRVLDALRRLGARDNTIVIFVSDHGFNLGEHGSWQKLSLWEESVRVPLLIAAPGLPRGSRVDAVTELIDLYPTVGALAGLQDRLPERLQGRSRVAEMTGAASVARAAYTTTSAEGYSLRTDRWRYNRWGEAPAGANEELYDHLQDPGEHVNLAQREQYEGVLDSLRRALEARRVLAREARPR